MRSSQEPSSSNNRLTQTSLLELAQLEFSVAHADRHDQTRATSQTHLDHNQSRYKVDALPDREAPKLLIFYVLLPGTMNGVFCFSLVTQLLLQHPLSTAICFKLAASK